MNLKIVVLLFCAGLLSSCLKTRSDVGENEQSQVYSKKNASNQAAAPESQLNQKAAGSQEVDERDDLIRALNGRVESLEKQIANSNKEKTAATSQDAQKIELLQEALSKMQAQLQKLEAEQIQKKAAQEAAEVAKVEEPPPTKTVKKNGKEHVVPTAKSGTKSGEKNANTYEIAQGFFANHEWKKAILNYQKYADDFPKGKEVPDAKYKIGVCFQELGMKEEAMAFFEEVVANYGKADAGKKAKVRLSKLKK